MVSVAWFYVGDSTCVLESTLPPCVSQDTMTGFVIDALKSRGIWNNTLIVASSDNGGPIGGTLHYL